MTDYRVEDLLSIIGDGSKSEPKPLSEMEQFIKEYKVISGEDRIPNYVIWYLYKGKFGGEKSKIGFFREFKKQFEQKRTGQQRVYMLSLESLGLTREDYIEAEFFKEK